MKSISPTFTALQFPLEEPAKMTELSSAATAASNVSFSAVPSCHQHGVHGGRTQVQIGRENVFCMYRRRNVYLHHGRQTYTSNIISSRSAAEGGLGHG